MEKEKQSFEDSLQELEGLVEKMESGEMGLEEMVAAFEKGDIATAHQWDTQRTPLLSYADKDAQWWEQLTQYKSTIYRMPRKYFGYPYVMYYNAGGKDATHPKGERIGIALSKDLQH